MNNSKEPHETDYLLKNENDTVQSVAELDEPGRSSFPALSGSPNGSRSNGLAPGDTGSGYVEFMRDSVPCPTCRGRGQIPKSEEGTLVALIPMRDKRLKPRRTYLYVCLAIFLCLLVAGLLLFFLCPRDVTLRSNSPYLLPHNLHINLTQEYVHFYIINRVNITNDNYFPVTVTGIDMTALYTTKLISSESNRTSMRISIRSENEYFIQSNITFDKKNGLGILASSRCGAEVKWLQDLIMYFQLTLYYSYFGHEEQTTLATYQYVNCGTPKFYPVSTPKPKKDEYLN